MTKTKLLHTCLVLSVIGIAMILSGGSCGSGSTGAAGAAGAPGIPADDVPLNKVLQSSEDLPGYTFDIVSITGGTGPNGNLRGGDTLTFTFTIKTKSGQHIRLSDLNCALSIIAGPISHPTAPPQRIYICPGAGPTSIISAAKQNTDKSWSYTITTPLPTTYPAQMNDSASFGSGDGELTGQPLLDGTYILGVNSRIDYTIDGKTYMDVAAATKEFLVGNATTIEPREIVKPENCFRCHARMRVHAGGGFCQNVKLCITCHTAGSEDKNDGAFPTEEPGTPGRSLEFGVFIHKIHMGKHLPSVNGVAVKTDGSGNLNYAATPRPYILASMMSSPSLYKKDFSNVSFNIHPNTIIGMPRDTDYNDPATDKTKADIILKGITDCDACHGDPDGSGPLAAPTQGGNAYSKPSRRQCGSCHDDIDWTKPYNTNGFSHQAQSDDSSCGTGGCHSTASITSAHLHPLLDQNKYPSNTNITLSITEVSDNGAGGAIGVGDNVYVKFNLKDKNNADVAPNALTSISTVISGPVENRNLILETSFPGSAIGSAPAASYTVKLPELRYYQQMATAPTATPGETFGLPGGSPVFWQGPAGTSVTTSLLQRTGKAGGSTTSTAATIVGQNYINVNSVAGFIAGDYVVIEDLGQKEYMSIGYVDAGNNRLWFTHMTQPGASVLSFKKGMRFAHGSGVTVEEITWGGPYVEGTDYSVNVGTSTITEITNFNGGELLLTYAIDFTMPTNYPLPIHGYQLDETWGNWFGKALEVGTYSVGMYSNRTFTITKGTVNTDYTASIVPGTKDFLFGGATSLNTSIVSSKAKCETCHNEVYGHDGRYRGYNECLLCHGTAGSEDRPIYIHGDPAKTTPNASLDFRSMLHKIHRGKDLANASTYGIVTLGNTLRQYDKVSYPIFLQSGKTSSCQTCHEATSTYSPAARAHSTSQTKSIRIWTVACLSCHDSDAAQAHAELNTSASGLESCDVCHDANSQQSVDLMHKNR